MSSFDLQHFYNLLGESREIFGLAGGDQITVDNDVLVQIFCAGSNYIVFDSKKAGSLFVLKDPCRNKKPAAVANGRNRLAVTVYCSDKVNDLIITPQDIGGIAAGDNDAIKILGIDFFDGGIHFAGVAFFAAVTLFGAGPHRRDLE